MDSHSRQEYVRAAISFLQNPKLIDSPLKDKLRFLKDKGLSDFEVDEALNLALSQRHQTQGGKWNFLLILGICVGGYKLYQAYLEQKADKVEVEQKNATGGSDQRKLLSEGSKPEEVSPSLPEVLKAMSELKRLLEWQRSDFKTEIQSLKTLLLGHEKFAAPPKIPEWQMPTKDQSSKGEPSTASSTKQKAGKKAKSVQSESSETSKTSKLDLGIIDPTEVIGPSP